MKYTASIFVDDKKGNGNMPVNILFNIGGKRFKVATGLTTSIKFTGTDFPSTEPNARNKTMALHRVLLNVDEYMLTHPNVSFDGAKAALRTIVTGKEAPLRVFADYVADYLATIKKASTRQLYEYTERKVREYDDAATFDTITPAWLQGFEDYWIGKGMQVNGVAIQLRNIRTVFNWCIDNEHTSKYPFRKYKIKQEKTVPNHLAAEQIAELRDYPVEPWQEIYRDLFMLSFYLCGINVGDLLLLKKDNVRGGRLVYKRRKTGHLFDLPIPDEAAAIIEKYKGKDWLLSPMDIYKDYHDFMAHWNAALKKIGPSRIVPDKAGKMRKVEREPLFPNITTYTARYSFASIAAALDIPRETIALCLGHAWADVTSHYIAYDTRKIDEAVRRVVAAVVG